MEAFEPLFTVGGAATTAGAVLAALLVRGIYRFLSREATIVVTQTCDDSYLVRVRVGFSLPRYVTTTTGSTSLFISEASNFTQYERAALSGKTALAQLGCPKSKQITLRLRQ